MRELLLPTYICPIRSTGEVYYVSCQPGSSTGLEGKSISAVVPRYGTSFPPRKDWPQLCSPCRRPLKHIFFNQLGIPMIDSARWLYDRSPQPQVHGPVLGCRLLGPGMCKQQASTQFHLCKQCGHVQNHPQSPPPPLQLVHRARKIGGCCFTTVNKSISMYISYHLYLFLLVFIFILIGCFTIFMYFDCTS